MEQYTEKQTNNYFLLFASNDNFTKPTTINITTNNMTKYPCLKTVMDGLFTFIKNSKFSDIF